MKRGDDDDDDNNAFHLHFHAPLAHFPISSSPSPIPSPIRIHIRFFMASGKQYLNLFFMYNFDSSHKLWFPPQYYVHMCAFIGTQT